MQVLGGYMHLYLGPTSSLELIRYLRSTNGPDGLEGAIVRRQTFRDAIHTVRAMDELGVSAQLHLQHLTHPIRAFVGGDSQKTSTKRLVTQVFSARIPHGAFLDLGNGICVCSPQFVFMLLAANLDIVDTVSLGMELCGSYSKWRMEPSKMGDPYYYERRESRSCTFKLPPAAKVGHMRAFVDRLAGLRGAVGARAALRWVLDDSASPMETATYLLLCLPKRLGGYGLPQPVLNPKLIIRNPDGVKERYPDLFWAHPGTGDGIDVEYNSDSDHSGEWSRYRDSKREVELVAANVRVLPLTRHQLMDTDEFDAFAQALRKMLGVRARKPDLQWFFLRDELRQKLLASWTD